MLVILLACGTGPQSDRSQPEENSKETDEYQFAIEVIQGSLTTFRLTLVAKQEMTLGFNTSQRYDFEVRDSTDVMVWKWSDGRLFLQVLGEEILAPGETLSYEEGWDPVSAGTYEVLGKITAGRADLEVRAGFEVTG